MEVISTQLKGVHVLKPCTIFEDFRGVYVELFNKQLFQSVGIDIEFVQDDISVSSKHVLRGIHGDQVTTKLVSCLSGRFYLVVVNNDSESPEYRQWQSFVLSDTNKLQVCVPPKFGIGHLVLSGSAIFHYKQSTYYRRETQFTLIWDDPTLNIWWPIAQPILSRRDQGFE